MARFFCNFSEFRESSDSEEDFYLHGSEDLYLTDLEKQIGLLRERIHLQERQKTGQHKRRIANFILFGSLIFLALLFVIGLFRDDFEPARLWWMFVGPLVGYLLRVIFEDRGPAP